MAYLSTACSVSLKDLRNLDKRRTKAEVAGRKKKLSVIHEQYLKVVSLRNKKKIQQGCDTSPKRCVWPRQFIS